MNWIAFQLVMHGPFVFVDANHWLGRWALPRAGAWAYRTDHVGEPGK